jgi:hypothetical protein
VSQLFSKRAALVLFAPFCGPLPCFAFTASAARASGASTYLPADLSECLEGAAKVRLRKVLPPEQERTILEGTLVTDEKITRSPNDLVWVRLPLPTGRIDLYGHLYASEGLAQG